MAKRVIPVQFVDLATGQLTMEAIRYLNDLDNGASDSIRSVGTVLAGVNQQTQAIIAGTQPLSDVLITGVGSVSTQIETINNNVASVAGAASAGALTASADVSAYASATAPGTLTTNAVTITASGGTSPYAYAWTNLAGDTFTVTNPTSAVTQFQFTFADTGFAIATYRCTVTDDVAATFTVDVSVYAQVVSV
jgi:hypothetical protein